MKTEKVYSEYNEKEAGLPQGAELFPFLYNIFISDTPRAAGWNLALYADDTALLDFGYDRRKFNLIKRIKRI